MRITLIAVLFGASSLAQVALAQEAVPGAAADLCRELLAYAEKKASEPPKDAQAAAPANAPAPRADGQSSGTQGGGSVDANASKDTSMQSAAPPTTPVAPGAAPEPTSSPHATDGQSSGQGETPAGSNVSKDAFKLAGNVPFSQVREIAQQGDRQACRDLTQKVRRAGGDLPAELIALAAYEPDAARRTQP